MKNKNMKLFSKDLFKLKEKDLTDIIVEYIVVEEDYRMIMSLIVATNQYFEGFSRENFTRIRDAFLCAYGVQKMKVLLQLINKGFFVNKTQEDSNKTKLQYFRDRQRKAFDQKDIKENDVFDIQMMYQYYLPIGIQQIQSLFLAKALRDKKLEAIDYEPKQAQSPDVNRMQNSERVVLFFAGGVTYSEISSLRRIGAKINKQFIIMTSNVVSGGKFLDLLIK